MKVRTLIDANNDGYLYWSNVIKRKKNCKIGRSAMDDRPTRSVIERGFERTGRSVFAEKRTPKITETNDQSENDHGRAMANGDEQRFASMNTKAMKV